MKTTLLLFLAFFVSCPAQDDISVDDKKPLIVVGYTREKPVIDGRLTEPFWRNSDASTPFIQVEPRQGDSSRFRTSVHLLQDRNNLYIGVFCADPDGKKAFRVPDLKRDFTLEDQDVFAVCIDGFNDERNSITFCTDPYGAQRDYLSYDDLLYDENWNGLWKVRTNITDSGWTAEFAIPWNTIRYPEISSDSIATWGINFVRLRRKSNELSAWSPYPQSFSFNRMEYAGEAEGLRPPKPSADIRINPYTLVRSGKSSDPETATTNPLSLKAGGELKWSVNTNTVLDATVNTDFAQADADLQVNNIGRFSVFFPEKRQFFLENASLFGPGLSQTEQSGRMAIFPFFSRRIGLDKNGQPIPIDGGVRLVNRSLKRNYGIMAIRQRSTDSVPLTHFFTGRFSRNLGKQDHIGVLTTVKTIAGKETGTDLINTVAGIDGFFRIGGSQAINAMAVASMNNKGMGKGTAGFIQYFFNSNVFKAWWTESFVTKNFDAETGFTSRSDIIATIPGFYADLRGDWLPFKKWIRAFQPGMSAEFYHQESTERLMERLFIIYPFWVKLHSGGYFGFSINPTYQRLENVFQPLGMFIEPGGYQFTHYVLYAKSDASKKISYTYQYDIGPYYNGRMNNTTASFTLSPIPHINIKPGLNFSHFKGVGEETGNRDILLYTLETNLYFNPRLQLSGLFQYNSQNDLTFFNVRFSWEYSPLSYLYLVYNSKTYNNTIRQNEQSCIFKLSYLKQF